MSANFMSRWPRRRNVALTLMPAGAPCMIEGNRSLIAQALANLVDNAIKYTPPGGQVRDVDRRTELDGVDLSRGR